MWLWLIPAGFLLFLILFFITPPSDPWDDIADYDDSGDPFL